VCRVFWIILKGLHCLQGSNVIIIYLIAPEFKIYAYVFSCNFLELCAIPFSRWNLHCSCYEISDPSFFSLSNQIIIFRWEFLISLKGSKHKGALYLCSFMFNPLLWHSKYHTYIINHELCTACPCLIYVIKNPKFRYPKIIKATTSTFFVVQTKRPCLHNHALARVVISY